MKKFLNTAKKASKELIELADLFRSGCINLQNIFLLDSIEGIKEETFCISDTLIYYLLAVEWVKNAAISQYKEYVFSQQVFALRNTLSHPYRDEYEMPVSSHAFISTWK